VKFIFLALSFLFAGFAHAKVCDKTVYLTFDTGNMAVAEEVAEILKRQEVKATFFLANEKTKRGGYALDDSWKPYWQNMIKQGHVFGSHTYEHTYFQADAKDGRIAVKSQFGESAGIVRKLTSQEFCQDIQASDRRFKELTGQSLSKIWRAPGGKTSPRSVAMGQACGYRHIGWAKSGFLGDELSSKTHPNDVLLQQALDNLQDGDITMAHLGIWSRQDPWAPKVLEPLIIGLKQKGFCFGTVDERAGVR
jgi:peptidoglycan/xylan/chitin deacetylase (PgdA/CDA1 family)